MIGGVIAAPFLDVLSERVERIVRGDAPPQAPGLAAVLGRARRAAWSRKGKRTSRSSLGLQLGSARGSGSCPGCSRSRPSRASRSRRCSCRSSTPAFALDRRRVPLPRAAALDRRAQPRDARLRRLRHSCSSSCPGLSFLCLPWLVTSGTLLVLELGPPDGPAASAQPSRGSGSRAARARARTCARRGSVADRARELRAQADTDERHAREVELRVGAISASTARESRRDLRVEVGSQAAARAAASGRARARSACRCCASRTAAGRTRPAPRARTRPRAPRSTNGPELARRRASQQDHDRMRPAPRRLAECARARGRRARAGSSRVSRPARRRRSRGGRRAAVRPRAAD